MTENWILHDILSTWGQHPLMRIWRVNTGGAMIKGRLVRFGVPGTPDILGVIAPTGRFLGIEVKSAKGNQRLAQERFERMLKAMGGLYILARSLADVDRAMAAEGITR